MSSRPKVSFIDHSYSGLPPGSRSRIRGGGGGGGGAKAPGSATYDVDTTTCLHLDHVLLSPIL